MINGIGWLLLYRFLLDFLLLRVLFLERLRDFLRFPPFKVRRRRDLILRAIIIFI